MSTTLPAAAVSAFTPTGALRASINLGNPILANRDAATGEPVGVSIDLAREFARRLGVTIELVVFEKAAASVDAVRNEQADIGFFAIDPLRSEGMQFTAPYVLIEGSYLVPAASPLTRNEEVDGDAQRIAVGAGSAYDLFLTREIKRAQIVRVQGAKGVMESLHAGQVNVAAGIRQVLEAEADKATGLRLLPGRFMVIQQAMGTPSSRGGEAGAALGAFVEEMKASGFAADALARHRIQGASVAPAGRDPA